jgi:ribonuclease E
MTRKRIGQGLLEAFSETCEHCKGRGVIIHTEAPAERKQAPAKQANEQNGNGNGTGGSRRRGRRGGSGGGGQPESSNGYGPAVDEVPDEDLVDTAEDDVAEERGPDTENDFEPIERAVDETRFVASADDPDSADEPDTPPGQRPIEVSGAALGSGRRRVIWGARRRSRP